MKPIHTKLILGLSILLKLSIILLLISLMLGLGSCVTYERCQEKFGSEQEGPMVKLTVEHPIPASNTGFEITRSELAEMADGARKEVTSGKTTASLTKTEKGYQVECNTAPDTIRVPVEVQCPPITVFQPEPKIIYRVPVWSQVLQWCLVAFCAYLSFRLWLSGRSFTINIPHK